MSRRTATRRAARLPVDGLVAIELPRPALKATASLARALQRRRTIREISQEKLPPQVLSDLLWAACGVNRRRGPFGLPGRTAATASNSQEIDVYVAMEEGTYLYDPFKHRLEPVLAGDLRALAIGRGQGGMGAGGPVRLIFVVDVDRLVHTKGFQEPGLHDPKFRGPTTTWTPASSRPTSTCTRPRRGWRPGSARLAGEIGLAERSACPLRTDGRLPPRARTGPRALKLSGNTALITGGAT